MTDQSQKTSDNSVAIQSQRDVTINTGLTPKDLTDILQALAAHVSQFKEEALETVKSRLAEFEFKILERFANDQTAKKEAFRDPDFQYVLLKAQQAQARTDDPNIADTLVDLIVQRSKESQRSRLSLSINDAIEKTAVLTANEFAALSLVFLLRHTRNFSLVHIKLFEKYLTDNAFPFLKDISRDEASYRYLQSHGCASISMGSIPLQQIFQQTYTAVFSNGIENEKIFSLVPDSDKLKLIQSGLIGPAQVLDGKKLTIVADDKGAVIKKLIAVGLDSSIADPIWDLHVKSRWSHDQIIEGLKKALPESAEKIGQLFDLWNSTPLQHLELTTTGFSIAHANLRRVSKFDASLSIWIK